MAKKPVHGIVHTTGMARPNHALTPGDWDLTKMTPRNVPIKLKAQVYRRYSVGIVQRLFYTVDHLVPLECHGTNTPENLWPQPRKEAKLKDADENRLAAEMKTGTKTPQQCVDEILQRWG